METAGFWMFGEALRGMFDNGTITVLQALLIYVSATVLPLGLFALLFDGEGFSRRVARIYKDFKDMRKLDENEIRRVAEIAENLYHKLPPGKKGHMTRLLARLNNAGIENKKTALSAKRELESYIEQNHSVNEMVGDKDLTTTFEDALEIAYEMAEADPETETTQHLKKALVKAGGNGKDLKAFYEWLDEQGVYTHPSLLETDDDEDDRIIDVGDDEDFEDYSLPHNWNDDNSLEDEYKRGLRFD